MSLTNAKLSVIGLWKVFGPHPKRILQPEWRSRSRKEVQQETGHVIALKDVTFHVQQGETFVVMGLSGSGKSTLVRCLLRLIEPSEGQVLVDGEDIVRYGSRRLTRFRRRKAGMVFQRFGLMPHRCVLDNVAWGLEIQGVDRRTRERRAHELLETVDLVGWENSYPHELSGGMQQRVGLARALAADPEILLMDEPFSALDPLIRREMQDELIRLQVKINKTIVFITHDLDEALKLGSRIAIMRDGEIIQCGTSEEIIMSPADEYVGEFTRGVRKADILSVSSIMKPPKTRVYIWQGPALALNAMREAEEEFAFVVDSQEQLLGVVTFQAATKAIDRGAWRPDLHDLIEKAPMTLFPNAPVSWLLSKLLDYDWRLEALPVVDSEGKLLGEVHRTAVRGITTAIATPNAKEKAAQSA
ncbi:MAG: glycine betaine/L-proline ABC transporter ATP-binding protein [Dehalococcoidia bacterium]|nr:glycine betaine/L-proline ABC transporter ATP-binding protein [Dehalococcoidia bacterium]